MASGNTITNKYVPLTESIRLVQLVQWRFDQSKTDIWAENGKITQSFSIEVVVITSTGGYSAMIRNLQFSGSVQFQVQS